MKSYFTVALAMVAGFGLGAVAVQTLHAQAKPPVYQISEIDVIDQNAFMNDYLPKVRAVVKAAGGKSLAAGGKTTTIEGQPPKPRVVVTLWESVEKLQAYRDSAAFKNLVPIRNKVATFRSFAIEGVSE